MPAVGCVLIRIIPERDDRNRSGVDRGVASARDDRILLLAGDAESGDPEEEK
jgi:hypothetical protein